MINIETNNIGNVYISKQTIFSVLKSDFHKKIKDIELKDIKINDSKNVNSKIFIELNVVILNNAKISQDLSLKNKSISEITNKTLKEYFNIKPTNISIIYNFK